MYVIIIMYVSMCAPVLSTRAIPLHTFTDYMRGGCQISLILAIDFTVSDACSVEQAHMLLS